MTAEAMRRQALVRNGASEANGALMRCAPLAVLAWAERLDASTTARMAREDALLSHPSPDCQEANAAFCAALHLLLHKPNDAAGALAAARRAAVRLETVLSWIEQGVTYATLPALVEKYGPEARRNEGHAKHAIVAAFSLLGMFASSSSSSSPSFEECIEAVLQLGGDTDTNACICGYLLGAIHGARGIPSYMRDPVLAFDCTAVRHTPSCLIGNPRPERYRNANVLRIAKEMADRRTASVR